MPPHPAPLGELRLRNLGDPSGSGSHELAHVSISSIASAGMDDRPLLGDESNPWRSRILIGSILGSELGVLLALFTSIFQPETDPVQFVTRLSILFAALCGLSILRRRALPATSET